LIVISRKLKEHFNLNLSALMQIHCQVLLRLQQYYFDIQKAVGDHIK